MFLVPSGEALTGVMLIVLGVYRLIWRGKGIL